MVNKMEEICYNFNIGNKYISREVVEDEICEWTDDKQQRIPLRGKDIIGFIETPRPRRRFVLFVPSLFPCCPLADHNSLLFYN